METLDWMDAYINIPKIVKEESLRMQINVLPM
jgi:hypothetical protein